MASPLNEEERENPHPPWSQLPTELLQIISQNIADDISDFIRFRCVCRSWRHAAKPSDLSPQLPWLLLPYDPESSIRSFYSFANESTRILLLPETRNQNICGSSNGWLIMLDKTLTISLFNPITRSLIRLPPITSFPGDDYGFRFEETFTGDVHVIDGDDDEVTLEEMTDCFDCFAFVSMYRESVNTVEGVVAFMVADASQIQYCRLGDAEWTVIDSGLRRGIKTMAFHKGDLYFVDSEGRTAVCELGPAKKEVVVIPSVKFAGRRPYHHSCHYLVTLREELMLVTCHKNYINENYFVFDEMIFEYHKLEVGSGGMMTWLRIEGAGDCTVFVTDGRLHSMGRLMTVASIAPRYRKDCLYYVVPPRYCRKGLSRLQVIMVDGDINRYRGPWTEWEPKPMSSSWVVPSLC